MSVAGALADSIKSTTAAAYLDLISRCGKGSSDASACGAVGGTVIDCMYGPSAGSTNFIPKAYGGDGGNGAGGWEGFVNSDDDAEMSCYPSYKMLMDALAPVLGLGGGKP